MLFGLKLEAEIKYMFFFKGENEKDLDTDMDEDDWVNKHKKLLKKNYIYVDKNNKLVIKNLGIRKKSNSELSKKIFNEYLVPKIKEGQIKFGRKYILDLINELLSKDITLACLRKDVGKIERYVKSEGSLSAQISRKYGSGVCYLIPNTKGIGIGKGKNYCSLEEFRERKMTYKDIDIDGVLQELNYFIKQPVTANIFSFEQKVEV
jgi:DNA polymerase elongation subunit (family B)